MPRRKVSRKRATPLAKRMNGLKKKAEDLATLCGVRIALVCADGSAAAPDVWESEEGVLAAYRALPPGPRAAHTHLAYAQAELGKAEAKLARVRQGGPAALPRWDKALDGATAEETARLLAAVDAALRAADDRRRALGLPDHHEGDYNGGVGLLEGLVAPLGRAAPPGTASKSNFVSDDGGYLLPARGDCNNSGARYEQAVMQPDFGFQEYPVRGSGGGADMGGYQLQMAPGMYGYGNTNNGRLAWDATQPGQYVFQCAGTGYGGMPGYHAQQHQVPCNGGVHPNPSMWSTGEPSEAVELSSIDLGLNYMDAPPAHAAQGSGGRPLAMGAGGSFVNSPTALSLTVGTGDNFTNAAPAQPLAMSYGGYAMQWPAPQQLQSTGSSQQSSVEQLRYLGDVEDTQLQLWGN